MTVLIVLGQAVSLWLMWRYRHTYPAPAEDGGSKRLETESSAFSS